MRTFSAAILVLTSFSMGCIELTDEGDKSCDDASDCILVNDCCSGCTAVNVDAILPECDAMCDQDSCSSSYGEEHADGVGLTLECIVGFCGIVVGE